VSVKCAGDWNGAGGHVNFSNNDSRKEGTGWDAIKKQISKLEKKHALHIASYGEGNERRLTGMRVTFPEACVLLCLHSLYLPFQICHLAVLCYILTFTCLCVHYITTCLPACQTMFVDLLVCCSSLSITSYCVYYCVQMSFALVLLCAHGLLYWYHTALWFCRQA